MIFPRGSPFPPSAHMRREGEEEREENETKVAERADGGGGTDALLLYGYYTGGLKLSLSLFLSFRKTPFFDLPRKSNRIADERSLVVVSGETTRVIILTSDRFIHAISNKSML